MLTAFFPAGCLQMHKWYQVMTLQKLAKIVTDDQKAEFAREKEFSLFGFVAPIEIADT